MQERCLRRAEVLNLRFQALLIRPGLQEFLLPLLQDLARDLSLELIVRGGVGWDVRIHPEHQPSARRLEGAKRLADGRHEGCPIASANGAIRGS